MKKGRYTAGRMKKRNTLTKIDKRKRSFTEVNFTILCYVGVFLLLANEINRCQCFVLLFFIGFFIFFCLSWRMFMLLPVSSNGKALGDGTKS